MPTHTLDLPSAHLYPIPFRIKISSDLVDAGGCNAFAANQPNVLVTLCRPLLIPKILFEKSSVLHFEPPGWELALQITTGSWQTIV